jgi:protein-S-isoprenylcysteine O-methyltransferase Ste14
MKTKDLLLVIIQLVLIVIFIAWPGGIARSIWYQIAAFIITISGIGIIAFAILNLGKSLTPFPTPKSYAQLSINGAYKFVRHPIYSGTLLLAFGISIYTFNIPRLTITVILFFFFYYKSKYEETMLKLKYAGYEEYSKKTGRFFPKLFTKK